MLMIFSYGAAPVHKVRGSTPAGVRVQICACGVWVEELGDSGWCLRSHVGVLYCWHFVPVFILVFLPVASGYRVWIPSWPIIAEYIIHIWNLFFCS